MSKKARKKLQVEIAATLSSTLNGLTKKLSEKKFQRNIRRASRILVAGVKTETEEKPILKKVGKSKKEQAI